MRIAMNSLGKNWYLLLMVISVIGFADTRALEIQEGVDHEIFRAATAPEVRSWVKSKNMAFLEKLKEEIASKEGLLQQLHERLNTIVPPLPALSVTFDFKEEEKHAPVILSEPMTGIEEAEKVMRDLEEKINEEAETEIEEQEEERAETPLANYAYLGQFLNPWEYVKGEKKIDINFENAELINLIRYFEKQYELTFILDDIIKPPEPGARLVTGVKFSFRTEAALNKKQAWNFFVKFLDLAGLMIIPGPEERAYLITNNARASTFSTSKDPVPTFIGIDYNLLPTNDVKIRYVYFIQNTTPAVIKNVADNLKSAIAGQPILIEDLNALILADRSSNIRSILAILKELDKPTLPETLVIIKLENADATKVKALYDALVKEETSLLARLSPGAESNRRLLTLPKTCVLLPMHVLIR